MGNLTDKIRKAIVDSGMSRYHISVETGIDAGALSRLVNGKRGIGIESAETIANFLGYEIVLQPKRRVRRRKGVSR